MDKELQDAIAEYSGQSNGLKPNNRVDQYGTMGFNSEGRPAPLYPAHGSPYDDRVTDTGMGMTHMGEAPRDMDEDVPLAQKNRKQNYDSAMSDMRSVFNGTPMGDKLNVLIAKAASGTATKQQMMILMNMFGQGM